jgi:Fe2+ or Zn2+ uptake regulation protein
MSEKNISLIEMLKNKGERVTKNRLAILKILLNHKEPLTSQALNKELKLSRNNCNRTTIYRELIKLSNSGIISSFVIDNGKRVYELVANNTEHHHHAICLKCNNILDVKANNYYQHNNCDLKNIGFDEEYHSVNIYGYCKNCKK